MIGELSEPIIFYSKNSLPAGKLRRIHKYLDASLNQQYSSVCPSSLDEYRLLLKKQQKTGGTAIICSGDGFLHHGLEYLVNSNIDLLPLPGGTANDFARESGWHPLYRSNGTTARKEVDCLSLNGKYFLTIAGSGIGTDVISFLDKLRGNRKYVRLAALYGKWIYLVLSLYRIFSERNFLFSYEIILDGKVLTHNRASSLFFCNQGKLGGLFHISRTACNADGRYEFVAKSDGALIKQLVSGIRQLLGKGNNSADLRLNFQGPLTVRIRKERNQRFFADGELLPGNEDHTYHVNFHPASINVIYRK